MFRVYYLMSHSLPEDSTVLLPLRLSIYSSSLQLSSSLALFPHPSVTVQLRSLSASQTETNPPITGSRLP